MISTSASEISSAAADWPIARPSPKLWRPMPVAISTREPSPRRERLEPGAVLELVDGGGARPDERRRRGGDFSQAS